MIQILDAPKSFGSSFSNALSSTLPDALGALIERKRGQRELEAEDTALESQGINLKGIRDPKIRHALLEQHGKNQGVFADQESQRLLEGYFGTDFANIYGAATEGGKTKLLDLALDAKLRNQDLRSLLGNYVMQNPQEFQSGASQGEMPETGEQQLPGMGRPSVGLTPKERAKEQSEIQKFNRSQQASRAKPILEQNDVVRKNLAIRRGALNQMVSAIENGDLNSIFDTVAEITGIEQFRSREAAKFKTAGKEFFLSNLTRAGARPNQWIEQQISDSLPKIGRDKGANLTSAELLKFDLDVEEKRSQIIDQLEDKAEKDPSYNMGRIGRDADKLLKPYVDQREKKLAYDLRVIAEDTDPKLLQSLDKVKQGTPITLRKAEYLEQLFGEDAEKVAKDLGYDIPDASILQGAQ